MPLNLDLYLSRIEAYKVSDKEGMIDTIKKNILDDFLGNPSHEEVIINGINRDVHIVTEGLKGQKLLCKPGENIQAGEYVQWNNDYFLCTYRHPDDKIQAKGTIQKCNHNLKWINKDNELITRYCIEDSRTLYTTGIKGEKVIDIPNGMVGIQLPYDEETRELNRKDSFIFNKTKYSLSFYDETTNEGLIVLVCEETEPSNFDDKINQIADRWESVQGGGVVDKLPWLDEQELPNTNGSSDEPSEGIEYKLIIKTPLENDNPDELWYGDIYEYIVDKYIDGQTVGGNFTFELDSEEFAYISNTTNNSCEIVAKQSFTGGIANLIIVDTETNKMVIEKEIIIMGI